MANDRFANEKYVSWLKVGLSLQFAKEGLETFTDDEAKTFHDSIQCQLQGPSTLTSLTRSSGQGPRPDTHICTSQPLSQEWKSGNFTCQKDGCDQWLSELKNKHVDQTPIVYWDNVNVPQLSALPWECAKLYMPYGCSSQQCAKDADIASLLTLYLKCSHFEPLFSNVDDCQQIKDIRNRTMHSATMEVETSDMSRDIRTIIKLLEDSAHLQHIHGCQEAVRKIKELRSGKMELSLNKELELRVLNDKVRYLEDCSNQLTASHYGIFSKVDTLFENYRQAVSEIQKLQTDNKTMNVDISSTKQDLEKMKGQVETFNKFLADYKVNRVSSDRLSIVNGKLSGLEKEISASKEKLEDLVDHVSQKLKEFDRELNLVKEEQKDQKRQLEDIQEHIYPPKKMRRSYSEDEIKASVELELLHLDRKSVTGQLKKEKNSNDIDARGFEDHLIEQFRKRRRMTSNLPSRPYTIDDIDVITTMKIYHMLHSKGTRCKEITVSGEVGNGKTSFCEHLANLWIRSQTGPKPISDDENEMGYFTFLFYISLRHVEIKYTCLVDLITNELDLHDHDVADLMSQFQCLIVFDGLDELAFPSESDCFETTQTLLKRPYIDTCTYLITSRPSVLQTLFKHEEYKVGRRVSFRKLIGKSQRNLTNKIISVLEEKYSKKKTVDQFFRDMNVAKLEKNLEMPVMLMQTVGLWYHKYSVDISEFSECSLYSSVIETQLRDTENTDPPSDEVQLQELPACFTDKPFCQKESSLLVNVSKLAFKRMFNEQRTFCYVFRQEQLDKCGIKHVQLRQLLDAGILTSNQEFVENTDEIKSLSFPHEHYQEFMSAIYISNMPQSTEIISNLISTIALDLEGVLELRKIFLFVCGLSSEAAMEMFTHLMNVVSADKQVQNHRQSAGIEVSSNSLVFIEHIKQIQDMIIAATEEAHKNNLLTDGIGLHDISVSQLTDTSKVERICMSVAKSICSLNIVKSPRGYSRIYENVQLWPKAPFLVNISLSHSNLMSCATFNENFMTSQLTVLSLECVELTHEQLQTMFVEFRQSENLRKIVIDDLKCHEHKCSENCDIQLLTFSSHEKLESIQLRFCRFWKGVRLCSTMSKLTQVRLQYISLSVDGFRETIESLPKNGVYVRLEEISIHFINIYTTEDQERQEEEMKQVLSGLVESRRVVTCSGLHHRSIQKFDFYN